MYDNLIKCPICKGVVQDGACTICGQQVEEANSETENEDDSICPNCHHPESKCVCGE